ncbi:acetyltransferase [Dyadobacter sp. CY326]|uniref:acetyltransferase n=1 Tax=Dyadobacter sp. CY326 TaxID=2907300 RepID=UPI001F32D47B|nr:acetyltransferase [Dyadobacter sp. CY326]MCE7067683.1 acetyltransferase [Dyadobacter sp. CY326]
MLIYGAGGHAKVITSTLKDCGKSIKKIFDDDPKKRLLLEIGILAYNHNADIDEQLIIAIGDNLARKAVSKQISHHFGNAIHPAALIDKKAFYGPGTVILHGAIIQSDAIIGRHVIVNTGAIVEHDCIIADFAHIAPGAIICGGVSIGACTLVGAGSVIIPNLIIGKNCVIGAGSVVTKNIPDGAIAYGNPARIIKLTHYE